MALAALIYLAGLIGPDTGPLSLVSPVETASVEGDTGSDAAVAANSPMALRATKKALWRCMEVGLSTAREEAAAQIDRLAGHPDQDEGVRAWLEKRSPNWQSTATAEAP